MASKEKLRSFSDNTVNRARSTGLNCHIFHNFQEYHESFSVNIRVSL